MKIKPPQLFPEQPVWASVLVLLSYLILGPYMQDDGFYIDRPLPARRDRWLVAGTWVVLTLVGIALFSPMHWTATVTILVSILTSTAVTLIFLGKPVLRVLVNLYQRRAPAQVRSLCPQSPSCSDYFLMSVNKYGVLKGGYLGWHRLKCCDGNTNDKSS